METEYLKRWRMALGGNAADGTGVTLTVEEQRLDSSLEAVYDSDRRGGLGSYCKGKPLAWRYPGVFPTDRRAGHPEGCHQASAYRFAAYREGDAGNSCP
ncbi:hypothetical protein NXX23_18415 [Bacteroides ovatus]|nr:hypothetical protein [Bacteroides ovatus]